MLAVLQLQYTYKQLENAAVSRRVTTTLLQRQLQHADMFTVLLLHY